MDGRTSSLRPLVYSLLDDHHLRCIVYSRRSGFLSSSFIQLLWAFGSVNQNVKVDSPACLHLCSISWKNLKPMITIHNIQSYFPISSSSYMILNSCRNHWHLPDPSSKRTLIIFGRLNSSSSLVNMTLLHGMVIQSTSDVASVHETCRLSHYHSVDRCCWMSRSYAHSSGIHRMEVYEHPTSFWRILVSCVEWSWRREEFDIRQEKSHLSARHAHYTYPTCISHL